MEEYEERFQKKPVANYAKHHKPDEINRPGRSDKAELKYRGNSSMAPRKEHRGKGKTLRSHRRYSLKYLSQEYINLLDTEIS